MKSSSYFQSVLIGFVAIIVISCSGNSTKLESENLKLGRQNDSLKTVLDSLHKKYIFDHAFVRHIPSPGNVNKPGSKYKGEIFFVAYNDEDAVVFSNSEDFADADTLNVKRKTLGTYDFETTLTGKNSYFYFKSLIRDKDAMQFGNLGYQGLKFKDVNK